MPRDRRVGLMNLGGVTARNWPRSTAAEYPEEEIIRLFHPSPQVYSEDLTELLEVFTYVEPPWANLLERVRSDHPLSSGS